MTRRKSNAASTRRSSRTTSKEGTRQNANRRHGNRGKSKEVTHCVEVKKGYLVKDKDNNLVPFDEIEEENGCPVIFDGESVDWYVELIHKNPNPKYSKITRIGPNYIAGYLDLFDPKCDAYEILEAYYQYCIDNELISSDDIEEEHETAEPAKKTRKSGTVAKGF